MALASSSAVPTRTSLSPVSRIALSNALLPPTMMTSCFSPVVSGSCQIYFGSLPAMHAAAADAIAPAAPELTGAEDGMVTSRAAGAMASAAAACMAGSDIKYIWQLPDTTGLKNEVIMVGGRSAFDNAIRLTGAKLVLVEKPDEIVNAISGNTAMIY